MALNLLRVGYTWKAVQCFLILKLNHHVTFRVRVRTCHPSD